MLIRKYAEVLVGWVMISVLITLQVLICNAKR